METYNGSYEIISADPLSISLVYVVVFSACILLSLFAGLIITALKGDSNR